MERMRFVNGFGAHGCRGILLGIFLCLGTCFHAQAARIDTVLTYSEAMNRTIPALVILPDGYDERDRMPVVYLLHGHGGTYTSWLELSPELPELADRYQLILVCADGGTDSWYWDSPVDSTCRYETYVSQELSTWMDDRYKTVRSREGRAITGLSMGGYGALYLAIRHQNLFGAAGSSSGGVDFRPFHSRWNIAGRLGSYADHPDRWDDRTLVHMLALLRPGALSLVVDCGVEDFFFEVNEQLHRELSRRALSHTYIVGPGGHERAYWSRAIRYQLQFFHYYFYSDNLVLTQRQ